MDFLEIEQLPSLRTPVLITAFAGWNDAAEVATGTVNHLIKRWSARRFATIDPEEFYVFTEVRPQVRLEEDIRRIDWPANAFHYYIDPIGERDYLLLVGVEPQLHWRAFTNGILELASRCGVTSVVSIGGLLAEVLHNREPRISGSGNTASLLARVRDMGIEGSRYEGPTGIVGVLQDACRRTALPAASLWGQVPHYLSASPNPQVILALLRHLRRLLDLELNLDPLEMEARRFGLQVDAALNRDPDAAAYVRRLEQQVDDERTSDEPASQDSSDSLPSGEAVVRELEDFLRRRRAQDEPQS
jgi:proteasome assembly chaperone (PAC2) family protein